MARTHFTRLLKRDQIEDLRRMLEGASGRKHPIAYSTGKFEIRAPDGDVVLAGLKTNGAIWICRLHREVFSEA